MPNNHVSSLLALRVAGLREMYWWAGKEVSEKQASGVAVARVALRMEKGREVKSMPIRTEKNISGGNNG